MKASFPLPDLVLKDVRGQNPREVLRLITEKLAMAVAVDDAALAKALLDAESSGGSAIGDGVAVVSARVLSSMTPKRICAFAQLTKPVAFRGVESHPCDLVFVMVSPVEETQAHLRDLSMIVRTLRDHDFTQRLRMTPNGERTLGLFRARDIALSQAA